MKSGLVFASTILVAFVTSGLVGCSSAEDGGSSQAQSASEANADDGASSASAGATGDAQIDLSTAKDVCGRLNDNQEAVAVCTAEAPANANASEFKVTKFSACLSRVKGEKDFSLVGAYQGYSKSEDPNFNKRYNLTLNVSDRNGGDGVFLKSSVRESDDEISFTKSGSLAGNTTQIVKFAKDTLTLDYTEKTRESLSIFEKTAIQVKITCATPGQ